MDFLASTQEAAGPSSRSQNCAWHRGVTCTVVGEGSKDPLRGARLSLLGRSLEAGATGANDALCVEPEPGRGPRTQLNGATLQTILRTSQQYAVNSLGSGHSHRGDPDTEMPRR